MRNMANSVLAFIQQGGDASSSAQLISYLNSYYEPILASGKGMSFGQDLYIQGAINEIAFAQTGDPSYLAASKQYYLEANQLGPDRPQALYGLFDVYRAEGDVTNTFMIGNKILSNWNDLRIRASLLQFASSTTKTGVTK